MTTDTSNPLSALSGAIAARIAAAATHAVAVRAADGTAISGLLWQDGLVVTAAERLEREDGLEVTLPEGRTLPATLAGRDDATDVALLRLEAAAPALPAFAEPRVGEIVLALGRGEDGPIAALGLAALAGGPWRSMRGGRIERRLRLDLRLDPAAEGGPVVDAEGRLIGMAVQGPRGRTLAIPASTIARVLAPLAERGRIARGYLGAALQPVQGPGGPALIVVGVEAGGPAAAAGLLLGDLVTAWDGTPLRSVREVMARLDPDSVGREVALGLWRAGAACEARVVLGERPAAG
jgi:S1-C subfamily serine protease